MQFRSKQVRVAAVGLCALALLAACGGGSGQSSKAIALGSGAPVAGQVKAGSLDGVKLTFVSWGGPYQEGQMGAAFNSFAKVSGAQVVTDGPTDNAKIKAQVDSGNVLWDVVDQTVPPAKKGCGTIYQPIDTSIVDMSKLPKGLPHDKCSVPAMLNGMIFVYNKKKYAGNAPRSWVDFFDTKAFPGKRGIYGLTGDLDPGVLEAALIADGVKADALYPMDTKRAFAKLSSIRKNLVFWTTGSASQQLIESGEVDMAMLWSGRAYTSIKNGADYTAVWNDWAPVPDVLVVPMKVKNVKASMAAINYYLGAEQQAKLTELTSYSGVNVDAKPKLDSLASSFVTTTPEHLKSMLTIDLDWWGKNYDSIVQEYSDWMTAG